MRDNGDNNLDSAYGRLSGLHLRVGSFIMLAFFMAILYNRGMYIRRAAMIFQGGGMVEGQDYNQIIDIAHHFGFTGTYVNGFLTNENEFVGGEVALKIAKEAGQVPADHSKLHPEDLFGSEGYEIN